MQKPTRMHACMHGRMPVCVQVLRVARRTTANMLVVSFLMLVVSLVVSVETTNMRVGGTRGRTYEVCVQRQRQRCSRESNPRQAIIKRRRKCKKGQPTFLDHWSRDSGPNKSGCPLSDLCRSPRACMHVCMHVSMCACTYARKCCASRVASMRTFW